MKKIIMSFFVLTFLISFSSPTFAQLRKDFERITCKLVSMDVGKSEVAVEINGNKETFVVKRGVDSSLQIGSEVIVMHKIGTNVANWVKLPKAR